MDNFSEKSYEDTWNEEDFSEKDYVADIIYGFYLSRYSVWKTFVTKDMDADRLKKMQENVAKYFAKVCATDSGYIHYKHSSLHYAEGTDGYELCKEFIEKAREYNLWTEEAETNYRYPYLKEMQKTFSEKVFYHPPYDIDSILPNQSNSK